MIWTAVWLVAFFVFALCWSNWSAYRDAPSGWGALISLIVMSLIAFL